MVPDASSDLIGQVHADVFWAKVTAHAPALGI
jgi:hypothetical protein